MATETIDVQMTWTGVLPLLITALEDGTPTGKQMARDELAKMAAAADRAVELQGTDRWGTDAGSVELSKEKSHG